MRPESYRKADGCNVCKHCLIYAGRYFDSYFCGVDGTKHPRCCVDDSLKPSWMYTTQQLAEFSTWETSHSVSTDGRCDEWVHKT